MRALKIISEAVTASFRYPHVQIGKLPTYEVPPPATIYGHLAGVVGDWFEPDGLEFAYTFEHKGRATDLETGQSIERGSGKPTLKKRGWDFPVNVLCAPNPQRREFLLRPRLTLYLRGSGRFALAPARGLPEPRFCLHSWTVTGSGHVPQRGIGRARSI